MAGCLPMSGYGGEAAAVCGIPVGWDDVPEGAMPAGVISVRRGSRSLGR